MTGFHKPHVEVQCACQVFRSFYQFSWIFLRGVRFLLVTWGYQTFKGLKSSFTSLLIVVLSSLLFLYHHYYFMIHKPGRGKILFFSLLKFSVPLASFISIICTKCSF